MARCKDRNKQNGRDKIPALSEVKDESDAALLQTPALLSLRSDVQRTIERSEHATRSMVPEVLLASNLQASGADRNRSPNSDDPTSSESAPPSGQQFLDKVNSLQAEVDKLIRNQREEGFNNTDYKGVFNDMRELVRTSLKQAEEFQKLREMTKKQKEMLLKLSESMKSGKRSRLNANDAPEDRSVEAVQCTDDLDDSKTNDDDEIVIYLLRGFLEFKRKKNSLNDDDDDDIDDITIPARLNAGHRILAGRRDFPQSLLLSPMTANTSSGSREEAERRLENGMTHRRSGQASGGLYSLSAGIGGAGGGVGRRTDERGHSERKCPICSQNFSKKLSFEEFEKHVDSHFNY